MNIGFAGTPAFAQHALETLLDSGFRISAVLTQPDRPAGRGMKLTASPVKETALANNIPVLQPHGLRLDGRYSHEALDVKSQLTALNLDVLIVAAYGLILPEWTLALPRLGCLNIHASLLPRWRGAAPIQRAIEAGDQETGITIMQMDTGLDTGDILLSRLVRIDDTDNGVTLHDKLASCGAELIVEALQKLDNNELVAMKQPLEGVTYAEKILKSEAALDLRNSAVLLARRVRAFNPFPGATVVLPGLDQPVKVWSAVAVPTDNTYSPGELIAVNKDGIDLATGDGILRLLELQKAGSKRHPVSVFARNYSPT